MILGWVLFVQNKNLSKGFQNARDIVPNMLGWKNVTFLEADIGNGAWHMYPKLLVIKYYCIMLHSSDPSLT